MESRLPAIRSGRIFAWLFFAAFVGIAFGWFAGGTQLLKASRLRESRARAEGTVTSVTRGDSLNNPTAYYEFEVDGATVYGYSHVRTETAGRLGPQTKVSVTYLPDST